MKPILTVATYQGPAFRNQSDAAVEKILSICELSKTADIILFPETFVHGYLDNEADAKKSSIDLSSQCSLVAFEGKHIKTTFIMHRATSSKFECGI